MRNRANAVAIPPTTQTKCLARLKEIRCRGLHTHAPNKPFRRPIGRNQVIAVASAPKKEKATSSPVFLSPSFFFLFFSSFLVEKRKLANREKNPPNFFFVCCCCCCCCCCFASFSSFRGTSAASITATASLRLT